MSARKIPHLLLAAMLLVDIWDPRPELRAAEAEVPSSYASAPLPRYAPGLGFLHPLPSSEPDVNRLCRGLPQEEKNHVYIFLINGLDPLYLANLNGLCAYVQALGFAHAEVGQMTASGAFLEKIRRIRASDPRARIVLLGFSAGAYRAQGVVQSLKRESIPIDVLIYVGADMIREGGRSQPENVHRIVNITGHGFLLSGYDLFFNGTTLRGARNVRLPARHFALPSRPETLQIVVEELVALIYQDPAVVDQSAAPAVSNQPAP